MNPDEAFAPDNLTYDDDSSMAGLELAERNALRRVIGLSTELKDVTEVEYRQVRLERVVLAGVWTSGTVREADRSLAELALLAETAGSVVLAGSAKGATPRIRRPILVLAKRGSCAR